MRRTLKIKNPIYYAIFSNTVSLCEVVLILHSSGWLNPTLIPSGILWSWDVGKGPSINRVDIFCYFLAPSWTLSLYNWHLCSKVVIWQTPSPSTDHVVYECLRMKKIVDWKKWPIFHFCNAWLVIFKVTQFSGVFFVRVEFGYFDNIIYF